MSATSAVPSGNVPRQLSLDDVFVPVEQPYTPTYRACPLCGESIEVDAETERAYLTECGGCSARLWVRKGALHKARY